MMASILGYDGVHFGYDGVHKMASILGVRRRISDTSGPIWMKLWGCIEFTLTLCNVIFSTSDFDLKPEIGHFSKTGSSYH